MRKCTLALLLLCYFTLSVLGERIIQLKGNENDAAYALFDGKKEVDGVPIDVKDFGESVGRLLGFHANGKTLSSTLDYKYNLFYRPRANLVFLVEGNVDNSKDLGISKTSPIKGCDGTDTVAFATTLLSSTGVNQHGIYGRSWNSETGRQVAFSKAGASPQTERLADNFADLFGSSSMIVSASGDPQLGFALGSKGIQRQVYSKNSVAYFSENLKQEGWTDARQDFISQSSLSTLSDIVAIDVEKSTNALVLKDLGTGNSFPVKGEALQNLVVELSAIERLAQSMNSKETQKNVFDNSPDYFSFGITSLAKVEEEFGRESEEYKFAGKLLRNCIRKIIATVSDAYYGRSLVEVVFVEAPPSLEKQQLESLETVFKNNKKHLATKTFEKFQENLPFIHIRKETSPTVYNRMCSAVRNTAAGMKMKAECVTVGSSSKRLLSTYAGDSSNDVAPTVAEIATYQMKIWILIVFFIIAIASAMMMCKMDYSSDSLLFRNVPIR